MILFATLILGMACSYLGSLLLTRRLALLGDALGHIALPGMALAAGLGLDLAFGAGLSLLIGLAVILRFSRKLSFSLETSVGIVFVLSLALGFLLLPEPELMESLMGDLSKIGSVELGCTGLLACGVMGVTRQIYATMMLLAISPELAASEGISEAKTEALFLCAAALLVALGARTAGSLLVGGLLIIPPAAARILCSGLRAYQSLSPALGAISSGLGCMIALHWQKPIGPSIILASGGLFLCSWFLKGFRVKIE